MELLIKGMTKAEGEGNYKALAALNREFRETVGINAKNQGNQLPGSLQRNTFIVTDALPNEEQGFLTREEIEQATMELLARYKDTETRELPMPRPYDGDALADS